MGKKNNPKKVIFGYRPSVRGYQPKKLNEGYQPTKSTTKQPPNKGSNVKSEKSE